MNQTSVLTFPISFIRGLTLKIRLNFKVFWVFCFISLLSLTFFYFFQVNSLANENYLTREYQKKLNLISKEIESLKNDLTKLNIRVDFEVLAEEIGFEKIKEVHYIHVPETRVVAK